MPSVRPFCPMPGVSQLITTSGSSSSVTFTLTQGKGAQCFHIRNYGGTNPCYIRIGTGAVTATSTDMVLGKDEGINIYKGEGVDTVAALQITGATTVQVTPGDGGV